MQIKTKGERLLDSIPLLCPGVFDALSAKLAAAAGFRALYLSGASISYTKLGSPDIGLVTMTETLDTLAHITEVVDIPIIVDADTGFGNALNVQRMIRSFERAKATVIQIEDQSFPKRCGHLSEKRLIAPEEMVGKVSAAVDARTEALIMARTDAIAVEGFNAALDRADRYLEAGADIIFIEAPETVEQMHLICSHFAGRAPVLANMVEGGRSPLLTSQELEAIGYSLMIFPGGTARALIYAMREYFSSLHMHGTTAFYADRMIDFQELQSILGTQERIEQGKRYDKA